MDLSHNLLNEENNNFNSYNKDYYISINNYNEELSIIAYNISLLDNIKYETSFDLDDLKSLSNYFINKNDINEIYQILIKLIKEKKFNFEKQGDDLFFSLLISDLNSSINNEDSNKEIQFILFGEKENSEYIKVLTKEIKKLRDEVNSLYAILNNPDYFLNQNALNSVKNKNEELFNPKINSNNNSNINDNNKNDNENFKENNDEQFNIIFKIKINNDMAELNLGQKYIGNQIFDYLSKFELAKLNKLILGWNGITNILGLENCKFKELKKLSLNNNNINNITLLQKCNFPQLTELWMFGNEISDISPLIYTNFEKLQILSLSYNCITEISSLKDFNFKDLKILLLDNNKIKDISALESVQFNNLEKLGLNNNFISDINVFGKVSFLGIKDIYLYNNLIKDISVFNKTIFDKLETLSLKHNKISDISCFENAKLKELKKLYLNNNKINNINPFEKIQFQLDELYLNNNPFDRLNSSSVINFLKMKIKNFNV